MEYTVQFPGLGLELTLNRVALSIGGFNVYWYGVIIALGMVLAMAFAFHYAADFGIDTDRLIDVIIVGTVMSIVCARIYYVTFAPFRYETLWQMIDIRQGGIAIYGAVIGAFVFGGLAAKVRHVPILPLFDLTAMGFLIGQGIGRWGNFVNQEAFGTNTTLPWGMYSQGTHDYLAGVLVTAPEGVTVDPTLPVHPTFLYESLWCLAGLLILWRFFKKRRFNGQVFLMYITWYGLGRFWIEGLRTDSLMTAGGLRTSQLVALVSVAASVALHLYALKRCKGVALMVPLAVADVKKQKAAGSAFAADELAAGAPHAEFVRATAEMNQRLKELDLNAAGETAHKPERQESEPENRKETEQEQAAQEERAPDAAEETAAQDEPEAQAPAGAPDDGGPQDPAQNPEKAAGENPAEAQEPEPADSAEEGEPAPKKEETT